MKNDPLSNDLLRRISNDCIAVRVRLINRVITALYDEALRPHGIRVSQGNILVAVGRMGDAKPADVCRILRIEKSTLSRDVELMKQEGWLVSKPPDGGRNQTLSITKKGVAMLRRTAPAWEGAQAEAEKLVGESGVAALHQIAGRLGFGKGTI
jgi:DNA-binding MarR family transcriptional regulator